MRTDFGLKCRIYRGPAGASPVPPEQWIIGWTRQGCSGLAPGLDRAMPERIEADRVRELAAAGAQLVEVLPPEEYAEEHLPSAINIPLKSLNANTTAELDKSRPVIVYCWDYY